MIAPSCLSRIESNMKKSPVVACGSIEGNNSSNALFEAVVGAQITKIFFSQPKSNGLLSRISK